MAEPKGERADVENAAGEENVAGYFRKIFKEDPSLLKQRSNAALFQRWLDDHPGTTVVPDKVKVGLQNIKNVLRKKRKKGGRPRKRLNA